MNDYAALRDKERAVSNNLLHAKYKSNLLENQIMAIAETRIEDDMKLSGESNLVARIYPGEIKDLLGKDDNVYTTLKKVGGRLTNRKIIIEDGENFQLFPMIKKAEYIDSVFIITFHEDLKNDILRNSFVNQFTKFQLSMILGFETNSAFRIYELLKTHLFKCKNGKPFTVQYNLAEFRFMLGLVDISDKVSDYISTTKKIDWDKAYDLADKKQYKKNGDLKLYVIEPAREELRNVSDLRFDYEMKRISKGNAFSHIEFTIYPNKPTKQKILNARKEYLEQRDAERQLEFPFDIEECKWIYDKWVGDKQYDMNLSKEDIDLLLKHAAGDAEIVNLAIEKAAEKPWINNKMGWIIECIKDPKHYENEALGYGSVKRAKAAVDLAEESRKLLSELNKEEKEEKKQKRIRLYKQEEEYEEVIDVHVEPTPKEEKVEVVAEVEAVEVIDEKNNEVDRAEDLWKQFSELPSWEQFIHAVEVSGFTLEFLESKLSAKERTAIFSKWNKGGRPDEIELF